MANADIAIGEPGAGLADYLVVYAHIEDGAFTRNAFAVDDVELCNLKGRSDLVFDDLHTRTAADRIAALLERIYLAYVKTDGGEELERLAAGGGFRIAEHNADLLAKLIDENDAGIGLSDDAGELPERLAHKPCLKSDVRIAHVALKLRLGNQRGNGVDNDNIYRAAPHERLRNIERLFAAVGLRDIELVHLNAKAFGINRIERMFRIDKHAHALILLRLRNYVERKGGLTGGLRAIDLNDPSARHAAYAQRRIKLDAAGGNGLDLNPGRGIVHEHDSALSVLLFNLYKC